MKNSISRFFLPKKRSSLPSLRNNPDQHQSRRDRHAHSLVGAESGHEQSEFCRGYDNSSVKRFKRYKNYGLSGQTAVNAIEIDDDDDDDDVSYDETKINDKNHALNTTILTADAPEQQEEEQRQEGREQETLIESFIIQEEEKKKTIQKRQFRRVTTRVADSMEKENFEMEKLDKGDGTIQKGEKNQTERNTNFNTIPCQVHDQENTHTDSEPRIFSNSASASGSGSSSSSSHVSSNNEHVPHSSKILSLHEEEIGMIKTTNNSESRSVHRKESSFGSGDDDDCADGVSSALSNDEEENVGKTKQQSINPFAQFAFSPTSYTGYASSADCLGNGKGDDDNHDVKAPNEKQQSGMKTIQSSKKISAQENKRGVIVQCGENTTKTKTSSNGEATTKNKNKKKTSSCSKTFTRMLDLPLQEQIRIRKKWQSLTDPDADLEVRRFQLLIAARLHARTQEPVIRTAMQLLREYFASSSSSSTSSSSSSSSVPEDENDLSLPQAEKDTKHRRETATQSPSRPRTDDTSNEKGQHVNSLCVQTLARANPNDIARIISSVHFANSKAEQIVRAARDVRTMFGGTVPETDAGLQRITGIGPVLADVLSNVNTRAAYGSDTETADF